MKPHWIDVEITEGCAIEDEKGALQKLLSLKELGVQISIDDFGTGYSSLAYLNSTIAFFSRACSSKSRTFSRSTGFRAK